MLGGDRRISGCHQQYLLTVKVCLGMVCFFHRLPVTEPGICLIKAVCRSNQSTNQKGRVNFMNLFIPKDPEPSLEED